MKHSNRWLRLCAVICTLVLVAPFFVSAWAATKYPYEVTSMDDVKLRSRANSSSTVLKKIKAGDTVTILGVSGDYYRVKFDGKTGYAMSIYIDGLDPSADKPLDASRTQMAAPAIYSYPYDTLVIQNVKLRKKALTEGEVICTILEGSMVEVLERTDNGFAKVKYEGKTGYVVETHINLADIPAPTPKPTATPIPGVEKYTDLKKGDSGDAVKALQSVLAELGYMDEKGVDGKFGTATETALKTFQKRNGYEQDGIATAAIQLKMYESTPKDSRGYRQYVKTVAPVPGALIRLNSIGEAVKKLQTRLKELGYYKGDESGVCDADTVAAIKMFEGNNGLTADGEMNAADQLVLYGATAREASAQPTPTPAPEYKVPTKTLRRGDKGDEVKSLQSRLKELGYYTGNITGTYNEGTEQAVKDFQNKSSLTVDGVCGPVTRTVLYGVNAIYAVPTAIPINADESEKTIEEEITKENVVVIRSGSMGSAVLRLQTRLQELGYYQSRLDGVYLTDDIEAVRAFQKASGLKVDGKAGYDTQTALYSETAIRGNGTDDSVTDTSSVTTLRYGSEGELVKQLQERLIALGYLGGTADGKYGKTTKASVTSFQKANSLKADGVAGKETQEKLYDSNTAKNPAAETTTLRLGMVNDAVRVMQERLIALGYLKGKADGNFGSQTSLALIAFQKDNGLKVDGIAGTQTLAKLNATQTVTTTTSTVASAPTVTSGTVSASQVRYVNWYSESRAKCRLYPNATIYDFTTGISWQVNMFSFGAHADAEPLTKEDTAAMNRAFGGKTTWTPKAVWVVLSDGTVYMASTHNTPHDTYHIRDNDFNGHLCIHFPRTEAQVEAIGPYATSHQKAIDLGWQATLRRAQ